MTPPQYKNYNKSDIKALLLESTPSKVAQHYGISLATFKTVLEYYNIPMPVRVAPNPLVVPILYNKQFVIEQLSIWSRGELAKALGTTRYYIDVASKYHNLNQEEITLARSMNSIEHDDLKDKNFFLRELQTRSKQHIANEYSLDVNRIAWIISHIHGIKDVTKYSETRDYVNNTTPPVKAHTILLVPYIVIPSPLTVDEWKTECNVVHNNAFDYSAVTSIQNNELVTVTCKAHNDTFAQDQYTHLTGFNGCKKCTSTKVRGEKQRSNTKDFIRKVELVHPSKYTYENTVYKTAAIKVLVTCPTHGEFTATPNSLLSGHGCRKCGSDTTGLKKRLSQDEFIDRATAKHNGKYTYNNVVYCGNALKVCITCPEHGEFMQNPGGHLGGNGCPDCAGDYTGPGVIYVLKCNNNPGVFKIGHTRSIKRRLYEFNTEKDLQLAAGFDLELLETYDITTSRTEAETQIHNALASCRMDIKGFNGSSELFRVDETTMRSIIDTIVELVNSDNTLTR